MDNRPTDYNQRKKNQPMISVIVPIYKVEQYLNRCVQSIINQTYTNLEILLVDDGSPDRCPSICDNWEKKDKRIRVIHKKNGGLSDARNFGIDQSRGDWLIFIDSDDYIMPDMCEKLLDSAEKNKADIAFCGLFYDYGNHCESIIPFLKEKEQVFSREEIITLYFRNKSIEFVVAWNKIYRRDLFFDSQKIRYPVGYLHEDEFTTYKLLYTARRTSWISDELYAYVQRGGSIMSSFGISNAEDILVCVKDYFSWSEKKAPHLRKLLEYKVFLSYLGLLSRCREEIDYCAYVWIAKKWDIFLQSHISHYLMNPYADWKSRMKYILFRCHCYFPLQCIWNKYIKKFFLNS